MGRHFVIALLVLLMGCGTSYQQTVVKKSDSALDPGKAVLISVPEDGFYGTAVYKGSGQMTAGVSRGAFLRFATTVDVTGECHGSDCLDQARGGSYGYYVQPEILRWEDRATEWSGISDKVEIRLTVFDAVTRQQIASQVVAGRSSIWTFGGDHPQDLLPEPVTEYVGGLYR